MDNTNKTLDLIEPKKKNKNLFDIFANKNKKQSKKQGFLKKALTTCALASVICMGTLATIPGNAHAEHIKQYKDYTLKYEECMKIPAKHLKEGQTGYYFEGLEFSKGDEIKGSAEKAALVYKMEGTFMKEISSFTIKGKNGSLTINGQEMDDLDKFVVATEGISTGSAILNDMDLDPEKEYQAVVFEVIKNGQVNNLTFLSQEVPFLGYREGKAEGHTLV